MGGTRENEFSSCEALRHVLCTHLINHNIPEDFAAKLAATIAVEFQVGREKLDPTSGRRLILESARWVIRDDDLSLCEALSQGILAAAAAGFFVGHTDRSKVVSFLTGIAATLFKLLKQVTNKGARLDATSFRVLGVLHSSSRPLTLSEILRAVKGDTKTDWTRVRVVKELERLGKVRLHDGTVVPMVAQDADDQWSAAAV